MTAKIRATTTMETLYRTGEYSNYKTTHTLEVITSTDDEDWSEAAKKLQTEVSDLTLAEFESYKKKCDKLPAKRFTFND